MILHSILLLCLHSSAILRLSSSAYRQNRCCTESCPGPCPTPACEVPPRLFVGFPLTDDLRIQSIITFDNLLLSAEGGGYTNVAHLSLHPPLATSPFPPCSGRLSSGGGWRVRQQRLCQRRTRLPVLAPSHSLQVAAATKAWRMHQIVRESVNAYTAPRPTHLLPLPSSLRFRRGRERSSQELRGRSLE